MAFELRRPGPTGLQAPIPTFTTFFSDGTSLASPSDGTQTATHGLWVRVGDRKFLGTGYFFAFDANRALTTITKIRINYQLSIDGQTLTGTTEAVVLEPTGKILNTLPGASILHDSAEPGDTWRLLRISEATVKPGGQSPTIHGGFAGIASSPPENPS